MSGMTSERLAEIRALQRTNITTGDTWSHMWRAFGAVDALLAHVDHLTAENARLREGIAELVSVGYSHTPDCEADDWQRVEYGGHPDCGLCWEDKLATLLNPPTEEQPCCRYCGEPGSDHPYPCC